MAEDTITSIHMNKQALFGLGRKERKKKGQKMEGKRRESGEKIN